MVWALMGASATPHIWHPSSIFHRFSLNRVLEGVCVCVHVGMGAAARGTLDRLPNNVSEKEKFRDFKAKGWFPMGAVLIK